MPRTSPTWPGARAPPPVVALHARASRRRSAGADPTAYRVVQETLAGAGARRRGEATVTVRYRPTPSSRGRRRIQRPAPMGIAERGLYGASCAPAARDGGLGLRLPLGSAA
jgi:hypothetical protein